MSAFSPEEFMVEPNQSTFEQLRKDDLILLGKHLKLEVKSPMRKREIQKLIMEHLVHVTKSFEQSVLSTYTAHKCNTQIYFKTHKYISKHTSIIQNTQIYFKTHKYISKHTNIFQNTQIYFKAHKYISKHTNMFIFSKHRNKCRNTEIIVETPK